ncbi:restriction endonuclease subunit S [Microcoleus sp. B6-A1]|uniref:restriction endonuclease subunit S n=1 Tax=Microcoleus sp. B6-A1 TaxID=2818684 RepID=UPI002FD2A043
MRETVVKTVEFKDSPLGKIPTGWQVGRLSNFYAVPARNGLYKSAQYYGRGILMIHMSQMFRGLEIDISDAARVEVNPTELERFELKPGDLVFARRSLNLEGAGRCSLVPELPEPVTFESSIIRVRLSREQLRPAFANYFLNSEIGFRLRLPLIRQVAVSGVSSEDIASIPILVPPIPEQEGIIEIISTVDETIAHTSSLIAKLKQMKAGLLYDLLTRGLHENGELRDAIAHPEQFKDSPLGQIPKNWSVSSVGEGIVKIEQGWSPDCESISTPIGEWGVLKTTAVVWEGYQDCENKRLPSHLQPDPNYQVKVGDVLMTRAGPNSRVGVVALVDNTQGKLMLSDKLYRLVPGENIEPEFLVSALSSSGTQNYLSRRKTGLAESQTNISQDIVRTLLIPLPPLGEQEQITSVLDKYNTCIRTEEAYREKLKLQKQGLMHDLLTGKVRVKEADKFTPASDTV